MSKITNCKECEYYKPYGPDDRFCAICKKSKMAMGLTDCQRLPTICKFAEPKKPEPEPSAFDIALAEHKRNFGSGGRYDERFCTGWNAAVAAASNQLNQLSWDREIIEDCQDRIRKLEEKPNDNS